MKRQGICDARCARCRWSVQIYHGTNGGHGVCCDWMQHHDRRRPCPAGPGCTEYAPRKKRKGAGTAG